MNRRNILKYIVISFFLMGINFQISNAAATPVDLIHSYYHIWGNYSYEYDYVFEGDNPDPTPLIATGSYDNTANTWISGGYDIDYIWDEAIPSNVTAKSHAYEFGLKVYANADFEFAYTDALAEAEWIFQPKDHVDELIISYKSFYDPYTAFGCLLEDQTNGTVLGNYTGGLKAGLFFNMTQSYPYYNGAQVVYNYWDGDLSFSNLTSENEYRLYLWAWSNANYDSELMTIEAVNMYSVPEPANMILLSSGLVGLAGLRKKFRKG